MDLYTFLRVLHARLPIEVIGSHSSSNSTTEKIHSLTISYVWPKNEEISSFSSPSSPTFSSSPPLTSLSAHTGRLLPGARQVYEQSAMAEAQPDGAVLPPRGAGISTEAGEPFRATHQTSVHL